MVKFDQCGLFVNIVSPGVHTLLPSVLQRLDSRGIEKLILILKKFSTADRTSSYVRYCFPDKSFFHVWGQKIVRWCQIRRIQRVINQFKVTVTHSSHLQPQTCVHCTGETGLPSSVFRPFWNFSSTTFQSPEVLIQCGFIWKETMQLVSGKVEFNACQVSMLWHNSFLVSLWNFQPHPRSLDY